MSNNEPNRIPDKTALIQQERELQTLNEQLMILKVKGGFFRQFRIKRLERRYKKADELQFENTDKYLLANDSIYQKIASENMGLFAIDSFRFSVESQMNIIGSYSRKLSGSIHSNGYAYLYSSNVNSPFEPFSRFRYPAKFTGQIDRWGRIEARITESFSALFKNLPSEYVAHVDQEGTITLECIDRELDIFNKGSLDIGKLVGHLMQDSGRLKQFESNKQKMVERIENFREELRR